jgi:cytochrome c oxidase assembly protein Cox11
MPPLLRKLVYLALIFLVILVGLQPYNRFCQSSGKCQTVYVSDFLPSPEGNVEINIVAEVLNYRSDIDFEVFSHSDPTTVSGRKNTVTYSVRNISNQEVKFRPEFYVEPKELEKYVVQRECLCFREYTLKKGEELMLSSVFKIKSGIENDPIFKKMEGEIRIGYTQKALQKEDR